jgi:hypothetical protein
MPLSTLRTNSPGTERAVTTLSVEHSLTLTEFGNTFLELFQNYVGKLEQLQYELDDLGDRENGSKVSELTFHLSLFADKLLNTDWDSLLNKSALLSADTK